jgi:hypothetical protein
MKATTITGRLSVNSGMRLPRIDVSRRLGFERLTAFSPNSVPQTRQRVALWAARLPQVGHTFDD